jgi:hypothetical protein
MRRLLSIVILFVWPLIAMSQTNNPTEKNAEIMRQLRLKILTAPASEIGLQPTKDYPRVYTVLMDWPLEKTIVSAYGSCTETPAFIQLPLLEFLGVSDMKLFASLQVSL